MSTFDWLDIIMFKAFRFLRVLRLDRLFPLRILTYSFLDYFKGFENVEIVKEIFGEKTREVLSSLRVEFTWFGGYMGVNPFNGHLMVNPRYLNNGNKLDIYLDLIHELVHIRQLKEGVELFDANYSYVDRPTEIEAYRYAVKEAKKLGISDERICEYLMTEWMSEDDLRQLAKVLHIKCQDL
jgi:hypothetical protein